MEKNFKRLTDYLIAEGVNEIGHTNKTYLAHVIGVYRYMEARGCTQELCRAGMFHSIYGTELFQGFKLPLDRRAGIGELIGERAERLAYWNCAMDRTSFDRALERGQAPYRFRNRLTGEDVELAQQDFDDLCTLHLYDWLEQVGRSKKWDYRRTAYRNLAEHLGRVAQQAYGDVFAGETVV
jgi:hypothetical protein